MDSHGRPVCADGHTQTHTDSHGCPVCADGHTRTSCPCTSRVCWRTPTDVPCVLNRQPTWAKITQTVHGKGKPADSKDQHVDMCTDGQPQTSSTDVMCVLTDTHERPVCADRHPRTSCPQTSCVCWRTPTDVLCVLNSSWAKITQNFPGKGHRAESKDQRADMCTDGKPRTSCVPRGPKSPEQSSGRASMLSPRTSVLICVLMDSHGRPDQRADLCTDGQPRTSSTDVLCVLTDSMDRHGRPVCAGGHPRTSSPTWVKITRTVHEKGQRAKSKDQRADMCTDGQPQTSCVC
ncbi:unnamed protein product [Brassica rapa]|uniref:Uncharacterized protein n=1 Tax=Brassica campestris TaxID=3711 RepID=A0A8D9CXU3_BRACM|nr:unnamed protein product [Brassica rapa]